MQLLYSAEDIADRIKALAAEIRDYYGSADNLTVIALLTGGVFFAADLARAIKLPMQLDFISASSYVNDASSGKISFRATLKNSVSDRRILLIDDVLDTGFTMERMVAYLKLSGAQEVKTCVMMNKQKRDGTRTLNATDWTGFFCGDKYLVGYGLDSREQFRNLPYIAFLEPGDTPESVFFGDNAKA